MREGKRKTLSYWSRTEKRLESAFNLCRKISKTHKRKNSKLAQATHTQKNKKTKPKTHIILA